MVRVRMMKMGNEEEEGGMRNSNNYGHHVTSSITRFIPPGKINKNTA